MKRIKIPMVSPEIVQWLEESLPMSTLLTVKTIEELKFSQGQQSIIALLRRELEDQLNNSLRS